MGEMERMKDMKEYIELDTSPESIEVGDIIRFRERYPETINVLVVNSTQDNIIYVPFVPVKELGNNTLKFGKRHYSVLGEHISRSTKTTFEQRIIVRIGNIGDEKMEEVKQIIYESMQLA